ncbi:hypothetical protein [Segatella copri]
MKKLDSKQHKETPEEELKRLRKRVKQLEGKEGSPVKVCGLGIDLH